MKKKLLTISLSTSLLLSSTSVLLAETKTKKEETIYVSLNENGSVEKADASIHLTSDKALKNIEDKSNLDNIQNIKSDTEAEFTNGKVKWNTDEKELYYTGSVNKKTPIQFEFEYKLNGKVVKLEDALGQSGQFEMNLKAKNTQKKEITVNGKTQNLYVPYVVVGMIPFDKDVYSNINVKHAKKISDGNKEMIAFMTFPGMKDNFDIKDLDEVINITANTTNLKMDPIYLSAMPLELDMDLDNLDLEDLETLKDELLDGLHDLQDGTEKLYEGNQELNKGTHELAQGTTKAKEGSQQLESGANALDQGIQQAQSGSDSLAQGASQVANGNQVLANRFEETMKSINTNAADLVSKALAEKLESIKSLEKASQDLNAGAKKLDAGLKTSKQGSEQLVAATKSLADETAVLTDELNSKLNVLKPKLKSLSESEAGIAALIQKNNDALSLLNSKDELSEAELTEITNTFTKSGVEAEQIPGAIQAYGSLVQAQHNALSQMLIPLLTANIEALETLQALSQESGALLKALDAYGSQIDDLSKVQALHQGMLALDKGLSDLSNGSTALYGGTQKLADLTQGMSDKVLEESIVAAEKVLETKQPLISKLQGQVKALAKGSQDVAQGSHSLNGGLQEMAANSPKLVEGSAALNGGVQEMSEGAFKLSEGSDQLLEGSQALYEAVSEIDLDEKGLDNLLEYKDEIEALSSDNDSFTGKTDIMEAKHKFIYKTKRFEKEEEIVEAVEPVEEKHGFVNWLKNIFK